MSEVGSIYNLPGEGFVVEIIDNNTTILFDRQGLQSRILQHKQLGLDTSAEEHALLQINNYSQPLEIS